MATKCKTLGFLGLSLLLAACDSTPATPGTQPTEAARPPMTQQEIAAALKTQACPLRLQDLSGALLFYFMNHGKILPESLEDLRAYTRAAAGTDLKVVCPDSGKPYVYVPDGLHLENQKWIVFVYDADVVHNGIRWAIVGAPEDATHPVTFNVVPMDTKVLQTYLDANLVHP